MNPAYQQWKHNKQCCLTVELKIIPLEDPFALTPTEYQALAASIRAHNFALYQFEQQDWSLTRIRDAVKALGAALGLHRLDGNLCADDDGISALQVAKTTEQAEYIPYSNRAISWHTDGYYNAPEHRVQAFVLHNVRPARQGGGNQVLDYDRAYIHLADTDPRFIKAFQQADVMTIPENRHGDTLIRPTVTGPVFDWINNRLWMRYTARKRNILWKDDTLTQEALACLEEYLRTPSAAVQSITLRAGQGVISNNVLHTREAFVDDEHATRLMLRARYYDAITLK
jgi:hypothetical protein